MRTAEVLKIIKSIEQEEKQMKDILLKEATRDELIDELRKRESISFARINDEEGATLKCACGRYSFENETWIFAIKPCRKDETSGGFWI